jgi:RimJ/RimL family protein N-acetyltransferase
MTGAVRIREVEDADLPVFFANQSDKDASWLAAVPSRDQEAFDIQWKTIRADPTLMTRTVLYDGNVAGSVLSFERGGLREVGYWIGRAYWGKGIATRALAALLEEDTTRPLHARVAGDNLASVRVLEKCGFERIDSKRVFDETRGGEIDDVLYVLR